MRVVAAIQDGMRVFRVQEGGSLELPGECPQANSGPFILVP